MKRIFILIPGWEYSGILVGGRYKEISIPPQRVNGNSKGEGVAKTKVSKKNMELKWNFQRGGLGAANQTL